MPSLSLVQPVHVHNYLQTKREAGLSDSTISGYRDVIGMLYRFRDEHRAGLTFNPWPEGSTAWSFDRNRPDVAKTPLIPTDVLRTLYVFADDILQRADAVLDERAERRDVHNDRELMRVRSACFFLIGLLTGMRCDEIAGIEVGASRTETKDGVTFHWVKSIEHKTNKGYVEYLMPSVGLVILRVMERWSAPLRARLLRQLTTWKSEAAAGNSIHLERMAAARANSNRLFLGFSGISDIGALSGSRWCEVMQSFAEQAGANWSLTPHQLRRAYAYTFARHRLGNLLFLKEQFKHSSLAMTQLYAANPNQDPALYEEVLSELRDLKVDVLQHWLSDGVKLSGGAGRKITTLRANAFEDREELIQDTAESVHIRSNGHAWCLAQDDGCGGAGLYERTRCANCSNGCIDDSQALIWKEIYAHQLELVEEARVLGPGAQQRVERDRKVALQVLMDLGIVTENSQS